MNESLRLISDAIKGTANVIEVQRVGMNSFAQGQSMSRDCVPRVGTVFLCGLC